MEESNMQLRQELKALGTSIRYSGQMIEWISKVDEIIKKYCEEGAESESSFGNGNARKM